MCTLPLPNLTYVQFMCTLPNLIYVQCMCTLPLYLCLMEGDAHITFIVNVCACCLAIAPMFNGRG